MKVFSIFFILLCITITSVEAQIQDSIPGAPELVTPKDPDPAKTDTVWRRGVAFGVNYTNVGLSNWAGGGQNAMSLTGLFVGTLDYKKTNWEWHNIMDLAYGFQRLGSSTAPFRKSDDRMYFQSKVSYSTNPKIKYTALTEFRSQFTEGFRYYDDVKRDSSVLISNIFAPAYLTIALGIDYQPAKNLSIFVSPLTAKYTFVQDKTLSDAGAYGVTPGKTLRGEYGASILAKYKIDIMKNVSFSTQLYLFNNYNNVNVDVFWDNFFYLKVNRFLTTTFSTNLIYDDDINVLRDNGTVGPSIQFKNVLAVGLVFKLNGYGIR